MSGARPRAARLLAPALVGLAGATLLAQYALDANLAVDGVRVGGRPVNAATTRLPMQRDIYRVNRRTGTMEYDMNAAFAAPRYQPANPARASASAQDLSYHRPVLTTGPDRGGIYTVDRRTGTFRYNEANALASQAYGVYQTAAPARPANQTIEIGDATPVYRPSGAGTRPGRVSAPVRGAGSRPGAAPPAGARAGTTETHPSAQALTPQRYRPPRVDLRDAD